jgi:hypothetical protein
LKYSLGTMVACLIIERASSCCVYAFLVLKWRSKFPVFYAGMVSVNSTDKIHEWHGPGKILLKYSKPRVITHKTLSIFRSVNDCSVICVDISWQNLDCRTSVPRRKHKHRKWSSSHALNIVDYGYQRLGILSMWRGGSVSASPWLPSLKIGETILKNAQNFPYLGSFLSVKGNI